MSRTVLVSAVLGLGAALLPAQTRYHVSPLGMDPFEGGANNHYPFTNTQFTYQQIHDDLAGRPRLISELAFRKDGYSLNPVPARSFNLTLRLSSTNVTARQAQGTFAANHGADLTDVLTAQTVNWPAEAVPAVLPAPFRFVVPFASQPFIYKDTPGFCWEVRVHQPAAVTDACDGSQDRGPYVRYGQGCLASGRSTPATMAAYVAMNATTRMWTVSATCSYLGRSQPAVWLIGTSDRQWLGVPLPIDLSGMGSTGCKLYTSVLFTVGGATDSNGSLSITAATLPFDAALAGAVFFSQVFSTDTGPSPLVFTEGSRSLFVQASVARVFASGTDQATSGTLGYPFGLVTRFTN